MINCFKEKDEMVKVFDQINKLKKENAKLKESIVKNGGQKKKFKINTNPYVVFNF
jgi:hypothetical protein